jgi:hypothetical protein
METPQPRFTNVNSLLPIDYSKLTDDELLAELKRSPDFDKMVFPNAWYSKYDLPEKTCMNPKEFIALSPWTKKTLHNYIKQEIIPAKPGGVRPVLPAPEIPMEVLQQNSYSDATDQTETSDPPETQ